MMRNALAHYNVNVDMLLRYASRRNIRVQIKQYLQEIL